MNPGALIEDLPQYAYDFELIGEALLLPVWAIYRELRRDGVVVSMDGHGADELLMGYGVSLRRLLHTNGSLIRSPFRTIDLARTVERQFPGDASVTRLLSESDPFLRSLGSMARRVRRFMRPAPGKTQGPGPAWITPWTSTGDEVDAAERSAMNSLTPINRVLYHQFHHGILQSILRKYDRISMAHGIEVRMPFMDWRLVCYAFSLPDESKAGGGYSKRVLREAMRGVLPEKVRTRTAKIGFQSPLANWLNGDLGDWVWKRVQTKHFLESEVWNGPAIRDFIAPRQAAKKWSASDAYAVWRYIYIYRQTYGAMRSSVPEPARRRAERLEVERRVFEGLSAPTFNRAPSLSAL